MYNQFFILAAILLALYFIVMGCIPIINERPESYVYQKLKTYHQSKYFLKDVKEEKQLENENQQGNVTDVLNVDSMINVRD